MTNALRYRAGTKQGVVFNVRHAQNAEVQREGDSYFHVLRDWLSVGVRSILKDQFQDKSGRWWDSVQFFELAPSDSGEENQITVDQFYVVGPFKVVRHETRADAASRAWREFKPR